MFLVIQIKSKEDIIYNILQYLKFLTLHINPMVDKENLSRWWGEDRENPRDEPLSLDRALARSRREVHPEGFPILTSSTWLIIYLAYFLLNPILIRCFSVCKAFDLFTA